VEELKRDWIDQYVTVQLEQLELKRFGGKVGRVITVNWNGKAIVDFSDGAWYDINPQFLLRVDPAEGKAKYDAKANSAQPIPDKQG
jgi:hypothetical protein